MAVGVALIIPSLELTIEKVEVHMVISVNLKVQSEAGVGVGPGLVKR